MPSPCHSESPVSLLPGVAAGRSIEIGVSLTGAPGSRHHARLRTDGACACVIRLESCVSVASFERVLGRRHMITNSDSPAVTSTAVTVGNAPVSAQRFTAGARYLGGIVALA